jgi:hypothetical protein
MQKTYEKLQVENAGENEKIEVERYRELDVKK